MAVVAYRSWPIVETTSWDADAARDRIQRWAAGGSSKKEDVDWAKYRQGFGIWNPDKKESLTEYKYPHHDVRDGGLVTPTAGIKTAMAFLLKDTTLPDNEHRGLYNHLKRHYTDADLDVPDYHRESSSQSASHAFGMSSSASSDTLRLIDGGEDDFINFDGLAPEGTGMLGRSAPIETRGNLIELAEQAPEVGDLFSERVGLAPDDIFAFRLVPSTQAMDSYGTRMSFGAISHYATDAKDGAPFMNSHRTGGFLSQTELPLGYSFDGERFGEQTIDETPLLLLDKIPEPDSVNLFDQGAVLKAWAYMRRGYSPNGGGQPSTDDIITGLESKSIRSISIGFWHAIPQRMRYVCGLCGKPIARGLWTGNEDDCHHYPLLPDKKTGLIAFAWIYGSRMYEFSTVWAGATPGATVVEFAKRGISAGGMPYEDARILEEQWGVKLVPSSTYLMGREVKSMSGKIEGAELEAPQEEIPETPPEATEEVREPETQEGETVIELDLSGIEDGIAGLAANIEDITEAVARMSDDVAGLSGEVQGIKDRLNVLESGEQEAQNVKENLMSEAVAARVRALGDTNEDGYRSYLAILSLDQIRAEIDTYDRIAQQLFKPGRPTAGADKKEEGVGKITEDPALYRGTL